MCWMAASLCPLLTDEQAHYPTPIVVIWYHCWESPRLVAAEFCSCTHPHPPVPPEGGEQRPPLSPHVPACTATHRTAFVLAAGYCAVTTPGSAPGGPFRCTSSHPTTSTCWLGRPWICGPILALWWPSLLWRVRSQIAQKIVCQCPEHLRSNNDSD